mmetsp:Transcript_86141/g.229931  ORF Transcript_86141/g.229931 Transcript_86141/m.229931 type:complete len:126 (+) Transcript_86141:896-1273(+)
MSWSMSSFSPSVAALALAAWSSLNVEVTAAVLFCSMNILNVLLTSPKVLWKDSILFGRRCCPGSLFSSMASLRLPWMKFLLGFNDLQPGNADLVRLHRVVARVGTSTCFAFLQDLNLPVHSSDIS